MAEATVGLTTVSDTGSMHVRGWRVPPELADAFAAQMTARYGEPEEMISDHETMEAAALRAAADGSAAFLLDVDDA